MKISTNFSRTSRNTRISRRFQKIYLKISWGNIPLDSSRTDKLHGHCENKLACRRQHIENMLLAHSVSFSTPTVFHQPCSGSLLKLYRVCSWHTIHIGKEVHQEPFHPSFIGLHFLLLGALLLLLAPFVPIPFQYYSGVSVGNHWETSRRGINYNCQHLYVGFAMLMSHFHWKLCW